MIQHFFPYAQEKLGFFKPVMVSFQSDEENANKLLGRTAQYNPDEFSIAIYVDGRHPKDILRSFSHELVHHAQNCNGDFESTENLGPGYAQENEAMRNAELDAYKRGNIIFRDFEDLIKKGDIEIEIDFEKAGEPKMSLKEWKNNELNTLLMKKWGLLKEGAKPDFLDLDKDGDKEESMKDAAADAEEVDEGIFTPNHYCAHHVRENVSGLEGRCTDHNWNEQLQEVTAYEVDFGDNNIRTLRVEELTILEASLAEEHPGHLARNEDNEDDEDIEEAMGRGRHYEGIASEEHADEEGNRPSMAKESELDEQEGPVTLKREQPPGSREPRPGDIKREKPAGAPPAELGDAEDSAQQYPVRRKAADVRAPVPERGEEYGPLRKEHQLGSELSRFHELAGLQEQEIDWGKKTGAGTSAPAAQAPEFDDRKERQAGDIQRRRKVSSELGATLGVSPAGGVRAGKRGFEAGEKPAFAPKSQGWERTPEAAASSKAVAGRVAQGKLSAPGGVPLTKGFKQAVTVRGDPFVDRRPVRESIETQEHESLSLTLDEARDVARRIFEKLSKETK